jgi:hypothetical protein
MGFLGEQILTVLSVRKMQKILDFMALLVSVSACPWRQNGPQSAKEVNNFLCGPQRSSRSFCRLRLDHFLRYGAGLGVLRAVEA